MSERRVRRVVDADRKSMRYCATRDNDTTLRDRLRQRRLHILLRRQGVMINRE